MIERHDLTGASREITNGREFSRFEQELNAQEKEERALEALRASDFRFPKKLKTVEQFDQEKLNAESAARASILARAMVKMGQSNPSEQTESR